MTVADSSQVGEVRRAAVRLAKDLGHDEVAAGRVAIVATELASNLVRHAQSGVILLAAVECDDGADVVEILSIDRGPGMRDVAASLTDGQSTGGTAGNGLGAVRRLSDAGFDIHSDLARGTVTMARIGQGTPSPPDAVKLSIQSAGIATAMPGEAVCGDSWAVRRHGTVAHVLLADGLGHGPDAAEASRAAVGVLAARPTDAPATILDAVHARLRSTRGAATAVVRLDAATGEVSFCGAGNIAGRLISGVEDRSMMSQYGTAGVQMRRIQTQAYSWPAHGIVVLHSDGLKTRWDLSAAPGILQHHPALIAAWLWRDQLRGRDDASVVVLKRRGPA